MDYNDKALEGFQLVLKNKWHLAQSIFMTHKNESNLMMGGAALVLTMDFFLSGSSSKHQMAKEYSLEVIKKCKSSNKLLKSSTEPEEVLEFISNEVLSIQCQVIHSVLSVAQNSDIISSCWNFKQAWHQHRKIYRELVAYVLGQSDGRKDGEPPSPGNGGRKERVGHPFEGLSPEFLSMVGICDSQFKSHSEPWQSKRKKNGMMEMLGISRLTICGRNCTKLTFEPRLLSVLIGQLSLGYGLFLMAFHLVPQSTSLQVLMHLFGLHDDRGSDEARGMVEKFMLSALGRSCFAPFSRCLLLHFLLVTRPLMVMNSNNLATAQELPKIELLLSRLKSNDEQSMFYFYFMGKFQLVKGEFGEAVRNFECGVKSVEGDLKFICNYELGRCKMVTFDWTGASKTFNKMRKRMPIMIVYHVYVAAVTSGAAGNSGECNKLLQMIHNHSRNKRKELSEFFGRRVSHWFSAEGVGSRPGKEVCLLLCIELLYLWNIIHVCSEENLRDILQFCRQHEKKFGSDGDNNSPKVKGRNKARDDFSLAPLCRFIEGVVTKELQKKGRMNGGATDEAEKIFLECLDGLKSGTKPEEHVLAFAAYELGLLKLKQGDLNASKEYFMKVKLHDAKHFFFKNKVPTDLEKVFASDKSLNLETRSNSDEIPKLERKRTKPFGSRAKEFFLQREKASRTTPDIHESSEKIPSKNSLPSPAKISPRKCLVRIEGAEGRGGDARRTPESMPASPEAASYNDCIVAVLMIASL